jgi:hypothetical protein
MDEEDEKLLRSIVEKTSLSDTVGALIRICLSKALPKSESHFDREVALRWGKAAGLLGRLNLKLSTPPHEM